MTFPGVARLSGDSLLLAGCLYNVGEAAITTALTHNGQISLPPIAVF